MILRAYVDESEPDQRYDPGCYLLAAAIVPDGLAETARRALRQLRSAGLTKAHWYDENDRRRKHLSEAVAALELKHLVVVRAGTHETSERRRRLCLRKLLTMLSSRGVAEILLEARQRKQDESDLRVVDVLRAERMLNQHTRVTHLPGPAEPLLWIPDVLNGVMGAYRRGNLTYFDHFAGRIQLIDV